jgi:hypothetical protein
MLIMWICGVERQRHAAHRGEAAAASHDQLSRQRQTALSPIPGIVTRQRIWRRRACSHRSERPTADRRDLARALDTVTGHAPCRRSTDTVKRVQTSYAEIGADPGRKATGPRPPRRDRKPPAKPRPHRAGPPAPPARRDRRAGHTAPRSIATGPDRARPRLIAAGRDETRDETRQPPPHARTEAEQRRIPLRHTPSRRIHAEGQGGPPRGLPGPRHTRDRHPEEQHLRQRRHSDPRRVCPASDVPQRP